MQGASMKPAKQRLTGCTREGSSSPSRDGKTVRSRQEWAQRARDVRGIGRTPCRKGKVRGAAVFAQREYKSRCRQRPGGSRRSQLRPQSPERGGNKGDACPGF